MVTFVSSFVAPECWAWERELTAELARRGADPWELSVRDQVRRELMAVSPLPRATLGQVADHIEHVREVAGVDHVGLGGDFDGTDQPPDGLEDVSCYPALIAEPMRRGWTAEDCGETRRGQHPAGHARGGRGRPGALRSRAPSTARIEDLDGSNAR